MYSRSDLITRALRELKALAAGQAPSAEDSKTIEESLTGVSGYLLADEIADVDFDAIADEDFLALSQIVAFASALAVRGEKLLRRNRRGKATGERMQADYF
jgi:hypothetical protein